MKSFASQGDLGEKTVSFREMAPGCFAYTAEGDPNSGVIIGDDAVMVIDAQATPVMARDVIARVRMVTDKPIKYVLLTHYHAVRVLGASAYHADAILASQATLDLIAERGAQDMASEIGRFPRLFRGADTIPGLTWPDIAVAGEMTVQLGGRTVRIFSPGRGHTKGDTVAWVQEEGVLYAGDLVEYGATPYTGDAYLTDWPGTLQRVRALGARCLVPGRGEALTSADEVEAAIAGTRDFVTDLFANVHDAVAAGHDLKTAYRRTRAALAPLYGHWVIFDHCLPFDVARAYDEARGIVDPVIWTAERDGEMWAALES